MTAHEQIQQALRKAQKQIQSHAEPSENPYARIADQEVDQALSLLDTHTVVPRERLKHVNTDSRDLDVVNYINGWNDALNYITQEAQNIEKTDRGQ